MLKRTGDCYHVHRKPDSPTHGQRIASWASSHPRAVWGGSSAICFILLWLVFGFFATPEAKDNGPIKLSVTFSSSPAEFNEPLVVIGTAGSADFLYVRYLGNRTLRFVYDAWGSPLVLSDPIGYEPGRRYRLVADMPAFHSAPSSTAELAVAFESREAFRAKVYFHTAQGLTRLGTNPFGVLCSAKFSGRVERVCSLWERLRQKPRTTTLIMIVGLAILSPLFLYVLFNRIAVSGLFAVLSPAIGRATAGATTTASIEAPSNKPKIGDGMRRIGSRFSSASLTPALLLVATAMVGNFLYFRGFGLYEDDWYYVPPVFGAAVMQRPFLWYLYDLLKGMIRTLPDGRSLQEFDIYLAEYTAAKLASLHALYVIAAILYCVAAVLMYYTLRLRFPKRFALLASLIFVLSPLTTIRQFLNGILGFAPGFCCLFLSLAFFNRRRNVAAYLMAILALLTYEPLYLPFLAAPFFRRGRRPRWEWVKHAGICLGILGMYLFMRLHSGEVRMAGAAESGRLKDLVHILQFAGFYFVHSFDSYLYAFYVAIKERPFDAFFYAALLAPPLFAALRHNTANPPRLMTSRYLRRARLWWWLWRVILPGVVLTGLAYGLSYFLLHDYALISRFVGRDTRISLAACFGSSILIAGIISLALEYSCRLYAKILVRSLIGVFLLSLFVYSFVIQNDYVDQWQYDRALLAHTIMLTPDVRDKSLLIFQRSPVYPSLFPVGGVFHQLGRRPTA